MSAYVQVHSGPRSSAAHRWPVLWRCQLPVWFASSEPMRCSHTTVHINLRLYNDLKGLGVYKWPPKVPNAR